MCVGRDRASQKALKVLVLSTQRVIHVNSFKPLDLTRDIIERMDDIASRDVDIGEDLLGEDDLVHPIDSSEPTLIDLADHQDFDDHFLDEHLVPEVPDDSLIIPAPMAPLAPAIIPPEFPAALNPAPLRQEPIEPANIAADVPPLVPALLPPAARKPRVPRVANPTDRVTRSMSVRNGCTRAQFVCLQSDHYRSCSQPWPRGRDDCHSGRTAFAHRRHPCSRALLHSRETIAHASSAQAQIQCRARHREV